MGTEACGPNAWRWSLRCGCSEDGGGGGGGGGGDVDNEVGDYIDVDDGYDDDRMVLGDSYLQELSHYFNFSPTSASSGINYIIPIFIPYFFRYSVVGLTHPS